jgi:hypothetical protein
MATVIASYNWVSGETVTPTKLNTTAAPTVVVADNEVTTAKILDANVTTAKIADANVTAAKLASNAVETTKIADDAVTDAKLSLAANAGEIKKALNADNSPPIYACRAWVNFDGTRNEADTGAATNGANVKIRASGNVSSVLKNGTGDFTITFTTAMPDANYAASILVWNTTDGGSNSVSTSVRGPSGAQIRGTQAPSASSITIQTLYGSSAASDGGVIDLSGVHVAVFR